MLVDFATAASRIRSGEKLFIAGDEGILGRLPTGDWIGGTIPYFLDSSGGVESRERVFVTEVPREASGTRIASYSEEDLRRIVAEAPENGFSLVIIPATSRAHSSYAHDAPGYDGIFMKPIIGWIAGVHLDDLASAEPKVFNGSTGERSTDKAIVMHVDLPASKQASVGIVNLFKPGKGDRISFEEEGFGVADCLVEGKRTNFAEYLVSRKIDTRLPLVADYSGAMVNVSFQSVDVDKRRVALYAPVFKGVHYRIAEPVRDYVRSFAESVPADLGHPAFSCNCILNYLYAGLEGKQTGSITGPITFGEIAYQLLNQTMVYLKISDVPT